MPNRGKTTDNCDNPHKAIWFPWFLPDFGEKKKGAFLWISRDPQTIV